MKKLFSVLLALSIALSGVFGVLPASADAAEAQVKKEVDVSSVLDAALAQYTGNNTNPWSALFLHKTGQAASKAFVEAAVGQVVDNEGVYKKGTDLAGVVIGLTASGYDVTDVEGYNLVTAMENFELANLEVSNDIVYMLLALDSGAYETSASAKVTRELLIQRLLGLQLPQGGWSFVGDEPEPDMTGIILTGLSPYLHLDEVQASVEKALAYLNGLQVDNSNSLAQMILGLISVGEDATADAYKQGELTAIEELLTYEDEQHSFKWLKEDEKGNSYSAKDVIFALLAYEQHTVAGQHIFYNLKASESSPAQAIVSIVSPDLVHEGLPFIAKVEIAEGDTAFDVLLAAVGEENVEYTLYDEWGAFVSGLFGLEGNADDWWQFMINGEAAETGVSFYEVQAGDELTWSYYVKEAVEIEVYVGDASSWALDAVITAVEAGLMQGKPGKDGTNVFDSQGLATRAEFAKTFMTLLYDEIEQPSDTGFTDVKAGDWYAGYVTQAKAEGIIAGYPDGSFKPNDTILRKDVAVLLARAFELTATSENPYSDVANDYAKEAIIAVHEYGLMQGTGTQFNPDEKLTREMLAVIMVRLLDALTDDSLDDAA